MEGASNELMASNPSERILWAASAGQDADYCHDDHKKQNVQNQETNLNADCSRTLYARNSTHDNEGYVYVQPNIDTETETESEAPHQGHQEGTQSQDEESRDVREYRTKAYQDAHAQLQATLELVRNTTKNMLGEIDAFLQATESTTMDYIKCQKSQRAEARRLEEVEPDVSGATSRFLQEMQGGMMGNN
jgi:hypothetical protein